MDKKIYIVQLTYLTDLGRDLESLKRVSEIHRQDPLEILLVENPDNYPSLSRYCEENKTKPINYQNVSSDISLYEKELEKYINNNTLAQITHKEEQELVPFLYILSKKNLKIIFY